MIRTDPAQTEPARRFAAPLAATLVAALGGSGFESGVYGLTVLEHSAGYLILCALLTVCAAMLVGLCSGALSRNPHLALAAWSALHGGLLLHASPLVAGGTGFGMGLFTWLGLQRLPRDRDVLTRGLLVAVALFAAFCFWPHLRPKLFGPLPQSIETLLPLLVYTAALGALLLAAAFLWSRPRARPLAALFSVALMWTAFYVAGRPHADRNPPHFPEAEPSADLPNVILLVLDTVGADHLSIYGYERETTPQLESFLERSARAVLYPLAHAPATWTIPSHASLFTGTLPSRHGLHEGALAPNGRIQAAFPPEPLLAEVMRDAGYRTAAVFANSQLYNLPGAERGFDWYLQPLASSGLQLIGERIRSALLPDAYRKQSFRSPSANTIGDRLLRFLEACEPSPCFVVANYMEAHAPYAAAEPHAGRFARHRDSGIGPAKIWQTQEALEELIARYDEEIRSLDEHIAALLSELDRRGILDRSWLVITSDHGEAFGEHGATEHGTTVYGEVTQIPLIIQPPSGTRLPAQPGAVSLLDVTATVAAVGTGEPLGEGRDLRSPSARDVQVQFFGQPDKAREYGWLAGVPARAVISGPYKLIEQDGTRELYRLDHDPQELEDLFGAELAIAEKLAARLPTLEATARSEGPAAPLTEEQRRALKALGYIE